MDLYPLGWQVFWCLVCNKASIPSHGMKLNLKFLWNMRQILPLFVVWPWDCCCLTWIQFSLHKTRWSMKPTSQVVVRIKWKWRLRAWCIVCAQYRVARKKSTASVFNAPSALIYNDLCFWCSSFQPLLRAWKEKKFAGDNESQILPWLWARGSWIQEVSKRWPGLWCGNFILNSWHNEKARANSRIINYLLAPRKDGRS